MVGLIQSFVRSIGDQHNPYTVPSRKRFLKHMEEGHAEAAVAEMEGMLKRLERAYLSRMKVPAAAPVRRAPATRTRAPKA